jgi:hypothetical protein
MKSDYWQNHSATMRIYFTNPWKTTNYQVYKSFENNVMIYLQASLHSTDMIYSPHNFLINALMNIVTGCSIP